MDRAAASTRDVLRRRHRAIAKQPEDFLVQNQKQLLDTQLAVARQLLSFVRWIGLSALAVAGLGVLSIAWIGVRDRTREIGTRRALGATRGYFLSGCVRVQLLERVGRDSAAGAFEDGLLDQGQTTPLFERVALQVT